MRVQKQNYKTRSVLNRHWEMQISFIKGEGFQATYYHGCEPVYWSECFATEDQAAIDLDFRVDKAFGREPYPFKVQTKSWMGVNITKFKCIGKAVEFLTKFNGTPLFKIQAP